MTQRYPAQRGFAAIAAIFLVVILAALGGFMLTFSNSQHLTSAQDVQGTRAYWAARAGLEWAVASLGPTSCWTSTPPATVEGFNMTVTCSVSSFSEGAATVYILQLTSVASIGSVGSIGFIERSVSASVER
jgi:MSHA biogenesis protein MshP